MIIHAASIHTGGGKILLDQLLTNHSFGHISVLICDKRYLPPNNISPQLAIYKISPNLISRWYSELILKRISLKDPGEEVLCFSNLPPAFKLKGTVTLYLQNALLLPGIPLYVDSFKTGIRIIYERIWLKLFLKNINQIWVQTSWMKQECAKLTNKPIFIKPLPVDLPTPVSRIKKFEYISVSGTTPHKRLFLLLKAWEQITNPPTLLVISDKLNKKISKQLKKLKNVTYVTNVERNEIIKYYEESKCLIVTSKIESYCLPLYEALHFNLKILAPDEGYVNDVKNQIEIIDNLTTKSLANKINSLNSNQPSKLE